MYILYILLKTQIFSTPPPFPLNCCPAAGKEKVTQLLIIIDKRCTNNYAPSIFATVFLTAVTPVEPSGALEQLV